MMGTAGEVERTVITDRFPRAEASEHPKARDQIETYPATRELHRGRLPRGLHSPLRTKTARYFAE